MYDGVERMNLLEALVQGEALPGDECRELALALDPARIPAHIAIIMDGNGRWAKRRGLPRVAGHRAGVATVRKIVEDCANLGVKALTLYAFSAENWKRPRTEIDMLWRLLRFYLRHELEDLQRNHIRLQSSGRVEALPERVYRRTSRRGMRHCPESGHAAQSRHQLQRAQRTGGRVNAIIDEARIEGRLSELVVDEKTISRRLYTAGLPEPDLLIRTSGEMRVSNFLLWQIAYAELYVTDTLWPDFNRAELLRAVSIFSAANAVRRAFRAAARRVRVRSCAGDGGDRRLLAMKRVLTAFLSSSSPFSPLCSLPGGFSLPSSPSSLSSASANTRLSPDPSRRPATRRAC